MTLSRRDTLRVLGGGAAAAALWSRERLFAYAASKGVKFKVGVTDWNLRKEANPESFALGKQLGFDGVQVSLASGRGKDRAPISSEVVLVTGAYREEVVAAVADLVAKSAGRLSLAENDPQIGRAHV